VSQPAAVLLSLHPAHAASILDRTKTVELRRRPPNFAGLPLVLYATAPVQRVCGRARIARVSAASPDALWAAYGHVVGVARSDFDRYFTGCRVAHALELVDVAQIEPFPLGFPGPQGFAYLRVGDPRHDPLLAKMGISS
jgi:predicted transcriptional regulator